LIVFKHLSIRHFRSWRKLDLPLDAQGVVCIQGETGAGKSSIFAGLFWGLYGMTPEDTKADEIRHSRKATAVRIQMTKDGKPYTLTRYRGSKEFKNKVFFEGDGVPRVVEDSHVRTVQGLINHFLGVPPQTFLATTYFAQRNFHYFHSLTDQAKKAFIESLTYGSLFEACEAESRVRARKEETAIARLEGQIAGLETSIKTMETQSEAEKTLLTQEIADLEVKAAAVAVHMTRLEGDLTQLKPALTAHHELSFALKNCQDAMDDIRIDIARYHGNSAPCPRCNLIMPQNLVEERLSKCEKDLTHFAKRESSLRSKLEGVSKDADKYDTTLQWLQDKQAEASRLRSEIAVRARALTKVDRTTELEAKLIPLREEVAKLRHQLVYTSFWIRGFGFQGLRSYVLMGAINYLASQIERYLQRVTGDRISFDMVIENNRLLTECNGRSYASLSGGERQAVDLSTGLAMRDLAQTYAKSRFNLLVLDEPHEGLDKHLTAVAQALLLDYSMPSTFLITHQEIAGRYTKLCQVRKVEGRSRLKIVY
jgi:DNA repair exonuclease SbcCD ATPase subunit